MFHLILKVEYKAELVLFLVQGVCFHCKYLNSIAIFFNQTRDPVVDEAIKAKLEAQLRQARGETMESEKDVSACILKKSAALLKFARWK